MKRILIFVLFLISSLSTNVWALDDVRCDELLPKGLEFTKNCQAVKTKLNFWAGPTTFAANGLLNAVVTMPVGTNVQWLVDVQTGVLKADTSSNTGPVVVLGPSVAVPTVVSEKGKCKEHQEDEGKPAVVPPNLINYLGQVANYGIVPHTIGNDLKPLDILILGTPMLRGSVKTVKLIGAIQFTSVDGFVVNKLLAVLPGTFLGDNVNNLEDLDTKANGVKSILQTWLENANGVGALTNPVFLDVGTPSDGGLSGTAYGVLNDSIF